MNIHQLQKVRRDFYCKVFLTENHFAKTWDISLVSSIYFSGQVNKLMIQKVYFCTVYAECRRTVLVSRIVHLHKDFIYLISSDISCETAKLAKATGNTVTEKVMD